MFTHFKLAFCCGVLEAGEEFLLACAFFVSSSSELSLLELELSFLDADLFGVFKTEEEALGVGFCTDASLELESLLPEDDFEAGFVAVVAFCAGSFLALSSSELESELLSCVC